MNGETCARTASNSGTASSKERIVPTQWLANGLQLPRFKFFSLSSLVNLRGEARYSKLGDTNDLGSLRVGGYTPLDASDH